MFTVSMFSQSLYKLLNVGNLGGPVLTDTSLFFKSYIPIYKLKTIELVLQVGNRAGLCIVN